VAENIGLGTCRTLIEWTPWTSDLGPGRLVELFCTHVTTHLNLLAVLFFRKEILEFLLGVARMRRDPFGGRWWSRRL